MVKNLPAKAGDVRDKGLIPGSGRFPGEGNGNPLQCSCLGNPRDGGAWWAAVYGVAQSRTGLKRLSSSSSAHICASLLQSCLTVCNPMDCSPQGFTVHGVFQARILKWVAISFSRNLPDPGI